MKKVAYGVGGLIVLLVAAALIIPSLIDWNSYKSEISAEAQKATGRTLEIAGDLELSVLPTPRVRVSDVRFANAAGAAAPHMATLKELRASVKLLPLLSGSVEIASIELVEPVIELEKLADGTGNWVFEPPPAASEKPASDPATSENVTTGPQAFSLDLLRVENGTVVYRDAVSGSIQRVENLTADMSAGSLTGPFTIKGGLAFQGAAVTIDGRIGKFAEKSAVPFDIAFGTAATNARIAVTGNVADVETSPAVSAKLEGQGNDLGALIASVSGQPSPPALKSPFSVAASIKGGTDAVAVEDLNISLGASKISGAIQARLANTPQIDVSLRSDSIDVNELLASSGSARASGGTNDAASAPAKADGGATAAVPTGARKSEAGLPADLQVNLTVDIAEAIVKKGRIRNIRVDAAMANGALTLNALTATLPGDARLNTSGRVTSPGGALTFSGKTSFQTSSLRALMQWLDADVKNVPADRLRRFAFSSDISGTAEQLQIANISGQLDATRLSGGVTLALRERPAFGASFSIDQINVDAYLGKSTGSAQEKPATTGDAGAAQSAPSSAAESSASFGPLAALNAFDANLQLRIGNLTYQKNAIRDVRVDGTLVNGALTFRNASIRNLAGTSVQLAGTVTGLEGLPRFNGTVSAASNDLTGLFRIAGIESGVSPRSLGKMRLKAKTNVTQNRLSLEADLQLAEATTKLTGTVDGLLGDPIFDISLNGRHPETARLVALLTGDRPGPKAGPLTVDASVKGNMNAVDINATTGMSGGSLKVSGRVDALAADPRLNLGVDLNQPDFVKFVRSFDPDYAPSNRKLGSLKLAAKLQGTGRDLAIRDLTGNVGPAKISGSGTYVDRAPRPSVNLALRSSAIPLSDFLEAPAAASRSGAGGPARASGGSTGTAQPGGQWSRKKIDTSALGMFDAEIDLSADALLYKSYRVDQPKILATFKDRVLDVRQIAGKMFDGSFQMKALLDGRKTPAIQATVNVVDARVDNAFFAGDSFDVEAGNLSHDLSITSRGASQYDLLRGLNGNGSLTVTDGVVRGFDLLALNRTLRGGGLSNLVTLIPAAAASIGKSKTTKFSSLKGTIKIVNGVVTTRDALLNSDGGDIAASGSVNLPAWDMNMIADIRPRKVREIPKLRVTLTGPPDQPNPRFNFDELTKDAITQGIGGLLQKVLPGAKSGSSSGSGSGQQGQQQQTDPAQELIKNIFKGLGR